MYHLRLRHLLSVDYVDDQLTRVLQDLHLDIVLDHVEAHRPGHVLALEVVVLRVAV